MRQIWPVKLPTTEKFVLLALADRANDDGGDCFPSQAELADKTGMTTRSVKNAIARLQKHELVTVKKHKKNSNSYQISVGNFVHFYGTSDSSKSERLSPSSGERDSPLVGKEVPLSGERDSPLVGKEVPLSGERDSPPLQLQPKNQSVEPIREQDAPASYLPPGAENYITMTYPANITSLAIRMAEIRRCESKGKKVDHDAIDYYSELIKEIQVADEYEEADIERLIRWFEHSDDGRATWRYGMSSLVNAHVHTIGRTDRRIKQHVLMRNLADYMARANAWQGSKTGPNPADHVEIQPETIDLPDFDAVDPALWSDALHKFSQADPEAAEAWIASLRPLGIADGEIWIIAPSQFARNWVASNHAADLSSLLSHPVRLVTASQIGKEVPDMDPPEA